MKYTILITVLFLLACSNLNNQESESGCIIDNSVKEMNYSFSYITTTTKEGKEEGFLRVNFADWMWLFNDKKLLNKAYVQKYGFTIGAVIIFFEKV